jgi:hypothetical protein
MKSSILIFLIGIATVRLATPPSDECPRVDGPDSVYIPHEECNKFWQCSNGVAYEFDCPDILVFDPRINVCVWPWDYDCEGSNSGTTEDDIVTDGTTENDVVCLQFKTEIAQDVRKVDKFINNLLRHMASKEH